VGEFLDDARACRDSGDGARIHVAHPKINRDSGVPRRWSTAVGLKIDALASTQRCHSRDLALEADSRRHVMARTIARGAPIALRCPLVELRTQRCSNDLGDRTTKINRHRISDLTRDRSF
jgi:hypothetical protein